MNDDEFADVPLVQFVLSGMVVWLVIVALASWMLGLL